MRLVVLSLFRRLLMVGLILMLWFLFWSLWVRLVVLERCLDCVV